MSAIPSYGKECRCKGCPSWASDPTTDFKCGPCSHRLSNCTDRDHALQIELIERGTGVRA